MIGSVNKSRIIASNKQAEIYFSTKHWEYEFV